jgi:filamentous hemagglutinin family protein
MSSRHDSPDCTPGRFSRRPARVRGMEFDSRLRVKQVCLALATGFSSLVLANPLNPTVVAGSATFQSSANALTITNANGTVIDWKGFSIGHGEVTRFIQANAASQVLNRVTGGDPSVILGTLQSNGRVFLLNQNGISFGPNAQVDVGGFVASSLGLSNADFLAGRLNFTQQPGAGSIVNQGVIRTASGGLIALVAPNVENHGVIQAPNGDVILAAGKSANLVDLQRPSIEVEVSAASNQALNVGQLVGRSIGIYAGAIRHSGVASATTAALDERGRVVFRAVGDTLVSGKVDAANSAGAGGSVAILGDRVVLFDQAKIDVSGVGAGGTALIGGNFQGRGPEQNASTTYVGKDVRINADAVGEGDGGKVIVWADGTTQFLGGISARGGDQGGNGGFVEVSGKGVLAFSGTADRSAPRGSAGTLLLDPTDLTISATGPDSAEFDTAHCLTGGCAAATESTSTLTTATLAAALAGGPVNVNATTGSGGGGGTINWTDGPVNASANSLTLTGTTITFNGTLTNLASLTFSTAPTGSGSATSSTGGSISGLFSTAFNLTGPTAGTAGGIAFNGFAAADTTTVTGAVGFDDGLKSNQGMTFASATTVAGSGTISNVAGSFADNTLVSAASGIDYAGFTGVTGTGTALTGMNGSFGDTTRISAASSVNYTGFALATVAGTGTALTGVATSFDDSTKASGSGINYSGLAGLATVGGGATALTGIASSFNDSTKVSDSGINYSGLGSLATVAGDSTADVTNTASFALTGANAGTGASGIAYSAFNAASNTTTVTGAVGFDDGLKSNQGMTFASAATVTGSGTISNVAGSFADNTLVSAASGIDYAGFTGVTGTGTALTGMNGSFGDTTRISAASGVNYTGFALATVAGSGTALTGVATSFDDSTRVSGSGINYSGLAGLATVGGGATALTGIATSFNDSTKVSDSGINYSGLVSLATVAGDGTADVSNTASFALTGANAGTGASGIAYSAFNAASNTTTVTGAVGFDDGLKSNQGMTFSSATTVAGTGTISNVTGNFAIDTLVSAASGIDYAGFTGATGTGAGTLTGAGQTFNLTAADAGNNGTVSWTAFPNLTATGVSTINGAVGSSLGGNLNSASTTLGGTIQTAGSQTYTGAVTLNAATTLTSTGGAAIGFANTLDGPFSLDVNTAGTTTFGGIVGGTNALAVLTTNAGGTTAINGGSVTTTGAQTYGDAVMLGAAAVLRSTGAGITATNSGNSSATYVLSLNTAGKATMLFDSFRLGTSTVGGNLDLTASGTIGQTGPVTVAGTTALSAPGQSITLLAPGNDFGDALSASGGSIQIKDTNGLSLGTVTSAGNLAVTAGGLLDVSGPASGTTVSLKGVGLTNSGTISGSASVTVDAGSGALTNNGTITNGVVTTSTAPIVLKGDSMSLGGTIEGNAAPVTLTSGTAGLAITLGGAGGLSLSLTDLDAPHLHTSGGLIIGETSHTGPITIAGTLTKPTGTTGGFTINAGYGGSAGTIGGAGVINIADNVTLSAHGAIGGSGSPIQVGTSVATLSALSSNGDIYVDKTGALAIGGISSGGGDVFLTATGPITQTGPLLNVGSLHATVTGAGGITLQHNDLVDGYDNTVSYLYLNAPGALAYRQDADYTVVQAAGNGMDFASAGNLNLAAVITGGPLNIDAGAGDVSLSTTGAISITGPGQVLGHNLNFNFANAVTLTGGSTANVSNDLSIKASGDLTINAASLTIKGGSTNSGAGQDLRNDAIVEAGGLMKITTTGDFKLQGGSATTGDPTAKAQASAFLTAGQLDLKVGGSFYINGGTATLGGGEANASAIVLVKSGKAVDIAGDFVLTGGKIAGAGTRATTLAVFDPELPLEIKTGGTVAVIGGSAPSSSSSLLASAQIVNAGPIKFTIGGSGAFTHPDPIIAGVLGPGIKAGLLVAGGRGSGLYDIFDNPVSSNDYPISYRFSHGGSFTVITDMTGYANALVKSRAPLGVDESLMAYINFAINTETIAKGRRGTSDQGNFKRRTAGQCS